VISRSVQFRDAAPPTQFGGGWRNWTSRGSCALPAKEMGIATIERRLDVTRWLRFRGRYLPLSPCPDAPRSASPLNLRPQATPIRYFYFALTAYLFWESELPAHPMVQLLFKEFVPVRKIQLKMAVVATFQLSQRRVPS
jgi:hypothetical protein